MFVQEQYRNPELLVIGAGGIGSNLIYNMHRDRAFFSENVSRILLYDGDKVERKNLIRQNFIEEDIGSNKAVALAKRYEHLPIQPVEGYFNPNSQLEEDIGPMDLISANDIIIGGVDNVTTRIDIIDKLLEMYNEGEEMPLYIDAGNETYHGNVIVLGDYDMLNNYRDILISQREDDDAPYNKSCGDIQEEDEGFLQIYDVNMLGSLYISIILKRVMTENAREFYEMVKGIEFGQLNSRLFNMQEKVNLLQREETHV